MVERKVPRQVSILFVLAGFAFAIVLSGCVLPNTAAFLLQEAAAGVEAAQGGGEGGDVTPPAGGGEVTPPADVTPSGGGVPVTADTIILQWDASSGDVSHYTVYFRAHGASDWTELGDVPAGPAPEFTVPYSAMPGNGEYDFGVVAVGSTGQRSGYHTSLDPTASPQTGWYVSWQK